MLLQDFAEVSSIDEKISQLHEQLMKLYSRRSTIMTMHGSIAEPDQFHNYEDSVMKRTYDHIKDAWLSHDVALPEFSVLEKKLRAAARIIDDLGSNGKLDSADFEIIAIPPYRQTLQALKNEHTQHRLIIDDAVVDNKLIKKSNTWRVMVAYTRQKAMTVKSTSEFLANKEYLIGDHDASGMGVSEYLALIVQTNFNIDTSTWSLLMKDATSASLMVAGSTSDGICRIVIDDTDGIFEDTGFRPAIVIRSRS